jgi:Mg/Co/Ni transporter MgtE
MTDLLFISVAVITSRLAWLLVDLIWETIFSFLSEAFSSETHVGF